MTPVSQVFLCDLGINPTHFIMVPSMNWSERGSCMQWHTSLITLLSTKPIASLSQVDRAELSQKERITDWRWLTKFDTMTDHITTSDPQRQCSSVSWGDPGSIALVGKEVETASVHSVVPVWATRGCWGGPGRGCTPPCYRTARLQGVWINYVSYGLSTFLSQQLPELIKGESPWIARVSWQECFPDVPEVCRCWPPQFGQDESNIGVGKLVRESVLWDVLNSFQNMPWK